MIQRKLWLCVLAPVMSVPFQAGIGGPTLSIDNPTGRRFSQFGLSTLTLDFDGDGVPDIAVGAPGEGNVYVFFGPDYAARTVYRAPGAWQRDSFGFDLAAGSLNGARGDELVVGAPYHALPRQPVTGAIFVLTHRSPRAHRVDFAAAVGSRLGNAVAIGDMDGDRRPEVIAGAPQEELAGLPAGAVHFFSLHPPAGWSVRKHWSIVNPQGATKHGNYGHDLSVADSNGDGRGDLFVSAIGNFSTDGMRSAGQIYLHRSPVSTAGTLIIQDPIRLPGDPPRFGMSIATADVDGDGCAELLVGSPRKDTLGVQDTGLGFLFFGPSYQAVDSKTLARPSVRRNDLLGFRALAADLIGGPEPDLVFGSLATRQQAALLIWDGGNLSAPPVSILRPLDGSDHYLQGLAAGPRAANGKQDLIVGDPNFSLPGKPRTGRVQLGFQ